MEATDPPIHPPEIRRDLQIARCALHAARAPGKVLVSLRHSVDAGNAAQLSTPLTRSWSGVVSETSMRAEAEAEAQKNNKSNHIATLSCLEHSAVSQCQRTSVASSCQQPQAGIHEREAISDSDKGA